jgi:hypothetical protein
MGIQYGLKRIGLLRLGMMAQLAQVSDTGKEIKPVQPTHMTQEQEALLDKKIGKKRK